MPPDANETGVGTSKLAPLFALFLGVGILLIGNGLQGTLLAVRGTMENFSTDAIGLLQSGYFLGFVTGSLLGVHFIERAGHIRAFAALASIASAAVLAHLLLIDPFAWTVFRAVAGFCFAGMYMAIESWLNATSENTNRGQILSAYMAVNLVALSVGQLMLGLADPAGYVLFCLISIIVSVALVPVALTRTVAPAIAKVERTSIGKLYAASPLGVLGCALYGLGMSSFWGLAPVYAASIDLEPDRIGFFMAITIFGGFITQWPIGRVSDRMDRRHVIAAVCLVAAACALAIGVFGAKSMVLLLVSSFLFGGMAFPVYSLTVAHVNDYIPREEMVQVSSSLLFIYGGGAILGPMIAGAFMGRVGPQGLYYYIAAIFAVISAFAILRMTRRGPAPEETQESFAPAAPSTAEVLHLDPRGPD